MKYLAPILLILAAAAPGPNGDPSSFAPAPMPDVDMYAPTAPPNDPDAAEVSPKLYQPGRQFRGDGFSYGSTSQSVQEKSLKPAPGVSFKMPLY